MPQSYKTVLDCATSEFTEKRSRFIGCCKPVENERQAVEFINERRACNRGAKHNVYAYSLIEGSMRRFSDDGEPSGTAGMPSLDIITKNEIFNVCVVVTRYFGGVLLGTGGLVRAYSSSVQKTLEKAKIVLMQNCSVCSVQCSYNQYGRINSVIADSDAVTDNTVFEDGVHIDFHIPAEHLDMLKAKIADATCATVCVALDGEKYFATPVN